MNYRRFVAYVYEYREEEKEKNRGFVRVEVRNEQCYMSFHLRNEERERVNCDIYAFVRKEEELLAVLLGSSSMSDGKLEYLVSTESTNIAGSGYSISDLGGLLIEDKNHRQYATQWDDLPVKFSKVRVIEHKLNQESEETEQAIEIKQPQEDIQIESMEAAKEIQAAQPNPVWLHTQGFHEIGKDWGRMQQEYESITSFGDGEIIECIKITPEDIRKFQHQNWILGNNSFMQHGYENYHYLILGKCSQREGYILGVPGVFDHQERFMASMFGFPHFKASKCEKACMGQFGYWYRILL